MKIGSSLLAIIIMIMLFVCPISVYAESSGITVHFEVKDIPTLVQGGVVFALCDEAGNTLDTRVGDIRYEDRKFDITFAVGELNVGDKFYVVLGSGAKSIEYNGVAADRHLIEVCANEERTALVNEFDMVINPAWNKETVFKFNGNSVQGFEHHVSENEIFITCDILDALGINYVFNENDEHPNVFLSSQTGGYTMQFFMNNIYAVRGGVGYNLSVEPFVVNGKPFIPLHDLAIYFACSYSEESFSEYGNVINISPSAYSKINYVNTRDLNSKTDYLVWVSKSDYKVNVYLGENGAWRFVKSFDCAIGAPSTPTVEGIFEYHQWQPKWDYDGYYCGPILRFYRGYAIHSTLIRYNGNPYDNRVGMKISHGCVRVRPEGIKWLSDYIPLGTTILVTK